MTTTPQDTTPTQDAGTLAALRALAVEPSQPITTMRRAADRQAQLLRQLLPLPAAADLLPAILTDLIPAISIDYARDIPVAGTSFWAHGHWHIHITANHPADRQILTVLHELKHIIDHPLRRQPNPLSDTDWEALANHFATRVLTREPSHVAPMRTEDAMTNHDPAGTYRPSPEPITGTGITR